MPPASPTRARRCLPALLIGMLLTQPGHASPDEALALANLSLEELLDVEVTAVSRFPQRIRSTAAAVSVITRDDIRTYGYRTFADIVASFPGTQVSGDRLYRYLAVGGISPPNDYNGRFLLLIDGQRLNDALYDSITAGTDFPLDIELIERVEFLRGPSSATYGNNALFGVFNVITRGGARHGFKAEAAAGSLGEERYRAQVDHVLGSGVALRGSLSHSRADGYHTAAAAELPAIEGVDGEHTNNVQFSLEGRGLRLAVLHGERVKQVPLPYYGTMPGDDRNRYKDSQGYISLSGDFAPLPELAIQGRFNYSYYDFKGTYPIDYGEGNGVTLNQDRAKARSGGGEMQFRYTGFTHHTVVGGISGQLDYRLDQTNFDSDPYLLYIDSREDRARYGFNIQDDWQLGSQLSLSFGGRYDHFYDFGNVFSPRVGAVWTPAASQTVKLQYGRAFRAPNAFERFGYLVGNTGLSPERAETTDLLWEAFPSHALRLQAGLHYTIFKQQITQVENDAYQNLGDTRSLALNLESEYRWQKGMDLKVAATLQDVEDGEGRKPMNSPSWLIKSQFSSPLPYGGARLGLEVQSQGRRKSAMASVDPYTLVNFIVSEVPLAPGLFCQAGVYNLLDEQYRDPIIGLENYGVDYAQAPGRVFRLGVEARF